MTINIDKLLELNMATSFGQDINNSLNGNSEFLKIKAAKKLKEALEKIQTIQNNRDTLTEVTIGDYVQTENGLRMVATISKENNKLQLYPQNGHYCCIFESGDAVASGTLDTPIAIDTLKLTDIKEEGHSWSFLFDTGAGEGINFNIDYKIWISHEKNV